MYNAMQSSGRKVGGATAAVIFLTATLCTLPELTSCQRRLSLIDYTPKSGPISGGTMINVTGNGFITTGADRSKCRFELSGRGNMLSAVNFIHNETFITCDQPEIAFLVDVSLIEGNRMTTLTITGDSGEVSNAMEFFLYDLDLIRVTSISPNEGLANSTNITLSISGENFLNTNEITCSVLGSYKVPALYVNSTLLECRLAPYPETALVVVDVSMNGQPVGNIPPRTKNSTTFTYFSSAPLIQSCQFTPSYAQLLLSFDREVEIGQEMRPDPYTSPALSCSDIFTHDTRQNVIGMDSACSWRNTLQREIVVELGHDNLVQLGSTVVIRNDTTRTRYVEYSRQATGSILVSLPGESSPQFLPVAVIEAPNVIPNCGSFTISGAHSQFGGARGLEYKWTIGTEYDDNGTLIQDSLLSDYIPSNFSSQSVLELSSDLFTPHLFGSGSGSGPIIIGENLFIIELTVRNFLGFTSTALIGNISRAEVDLPTLLIVGGRTRKIRVSDETMLEGRVVFQDGCQEQDQFGTITFTWTVADQFDRQLQLNGRASSLLVLPPYSLEVDSEYTATLDVEFSLHPATVSASVRLVTDIELVELKPIISGGTRRAVGANEAIELDGRSSQYINSSTVVLSITWTCVASEEECIDRWGKPLSLPSNNLVQIISGGSLIPREYNFTLSLTLFRQSQNVTLLEMSAYQVVVVLPHATLPQVEIVPEEGIDLESMLVHKELILNVNIQSRSPGSAQWTSEYVIGYAQVDLNDSHTLRSPLKYNITRSVGFIGFSESNPVLFITGSHGTPDSFTNQITLIISAYSLLPRNSYRLTLATVDEAGQSGFAEIDVHTESIPTSGRLLISPQNGSSLSTLFTLSALGWTDDLGDTPLSYQFALRYKFFNSTSSQLPPCCNLSYNSASLSGENISCVCEFMSTGISEQNVLETILPFLSQRRASESFVQVEQVVHVFDINGATTEAAQGLDLYHSDGPYDDDPSQLLQPLVEPLREELDVSGAVDGIRRLSLTNWREALAQLTAIVSFIEVNSFIRHSQINLTVDQLAQFKVKATELVLDIYETYVPSTESYSNAIALLLHSTTSFQGTSGLSYDDLLTSRILNFIQDISSLEISTAKGQIVMNIFQNLILNTSQLKNPRTIARVRENSVIREFLSTVPNVGLGLCASERHSFVNGVGKSLLKASLTNLPNAYQSIEKCNTSQNGNSKRPRFCLDEDIPTVTVNFSLALFERYLWWPCTTGAERDDQGTADGYCSGVCLTSVQHMYDLLWQGGPYESQLKSSVLQLYLLNPRNGSMLEVSSPNDERRGRIARNVVPNSDEIGIKFPILASYSNASNLQCAYWNETSRLWVSRNQFSHETIERNGIITAKICQIGVSLSSTFTILERCPDGQYGEACQEVCPEGRWGGECRQSCDCNNRGDCSQVDGSCDCNPGWQGESCETRCVSGTWGKNCGGICLCENGAECDHVAGSCACTPGWIGTYCNMSCPDGLYGNGCREECACNRIDECDKITGLCDCSTGFTGITCHQTCRSGSYGEGCSSVCQCFTTGTRLCNHVNGSCDCFAEWTGELCEVPPPPEPTFQIWWVVVGVVVALVLASLLVCVVIIAVCVRIKKRKKILPIADRETGDHVSHHEEATNEVAASSSGSGSDLNITHAQSLVVLVPKGKELVDIFISANTNAVKGDKEEESEFKEPPEHGGKLRWQIIRLMPTKFKSLIDRDQVSSVDSGVREKRLNDSDRLTECSKALEEFVRKESDNDSSLEVSKLTKDKSRSKYSDESRTESEDDHMTEVEYKRGVYLAPDATLKDLRNSFIEMEHLEFDDRYFHLLKSDVPGDIIDIDTEDETLLSQIEHTLVQQRTMYIENIDPGTVTMELCVCGKFADLECSECGKRGYCSVECQQDDWFKHVLICQEKKEEKKRRKRSKSKKKKKHKKHRKHKKSGSKTPRETTPNIDVCICGKEAEFECSRCMKQGYCSEDCQRKDWDVHWVFCEQVQPDKQDNNSNESADNAEAEPVATTAKEIAPFNRNTSLDTLVEVTEESEEESK